MVSLQLPKDLIQNKALSQYGIWLLIKIGLLILFKQILLLYVYLWMVQRNRLKYWKSLLTGKPNYFVLKNMLSLLWLVTRDF